MSLGGYIGLLGKHQEKHTIAIGDCKWSVTGKNGKNVRTKEEAMRSEEVMKQIQSDQKSKATAQRNRFEVISPYIKQVQKIEVSTKTMKGMLDQKNEECSCCHNGSSIEVTKKEDTVLNKWKIGGVLAPMSSDGNTRTVGDKTYRRISGLVDSGAVDSVTNERTAPWIPIRETAASKSGMKYVVADGRTVPNRGQQNFSGTIEDGLPIDLSKQITDVCKTLLSVRKFKEARNIVIFGADERDMISNKKGSGSRAKLEDNGKDYQLSIWMEVPKEVLKRGEALSIVEAVAREEFKTKSVEAVREGHATTWDRILSSGEATFRGRTSELQI
jgi:hypothetical protein